MIVNRQRRVRIRPSVLGDFLARVRSTVGLSAESVSVCFVSDAAIAEMNRRYRGKRGPTDVLSFPANGKGMTQRNRKSLRDSRRHSHSASASPPVFLGDIAISPETARRNARRSGAPLEDELRTLILHGVLHLLGYDHETDRGEMERLERRLRRELRIGPA